MDVRTATGDDVDEIREIATQTFRTSYSLSPDQIETLLEELFDDEHLADRLQREKAAVLVAESDGTVVGFVDVDVGETTVIRWLHVDPGARGEGAGTRLFEHVRDELAEGETDRLAARVMTEDSEGASFCEQFGFARSGRTELAFGSETLGEYVYTAGAVEEGTSNEPGVEVPETISIDGTTRYLDRDDETPGTEGPFYHVYETDACEERYGFFCGNCGSTDTGTDTLGRIECRNCGNKHLADEWDGAYF